VFASPSGISANILLITERYPSGQREQTVNLPAMPSKVRILPSPPFFAAIAQFAGIAQLVEREPSKLGVAGSSPVSRSSSQYGWVPNSRWLNYSSSAIRDESSTDVPR
jgi:hypothetical protein